MSYANNKYGTAYIAAVVKFLKAQPTVVLKLSDIFTPKGAQVRIASKLADHIEDLKRSFEEVGQRDPIIVIENGNGGYDVVEGVNRTKAMRELNKADKLDSRWFTINCIVLPAGFFPTPGHQKFVQVHLNRPTLKRSCTQADVEQALRGAVKDGVFGDSKTVAKQTLLVRMREWIRANYNFKTSQVKAMSTRAANITIGSKGIEVYTKDTANEFVDLYCTSITSGNIIYKVLPGTMDNVERRCGRIFYELARDGIRVGSKVVLFVHFPNIHSEEKEVANARARFITKMNEFRSLTITDANGKSRKLVDEVYFLPQMKNLEKVAYDGNQILGPF